MSDMEIVPPKNHGKIRHAYKRRPPAEEPNHPASHDHSSPPEQPRYKSILSTLLLFFSALVIAILLNSFVIQSYQVDGVSMQNTLQDGDRLIVNKIPRTISRIDGHQYVPHRGDIIIFNQLGLSGYVGEKQLIKRVIGLPGDHVVVNGSQVTIYNEQHPEGFDPDTSLGYHPWPGESCGNADIYLKSNELFVMGDHRGDSQDSRCFGPITTDQIVAKLVLRILPLKNSQKF